MIAKLLCKIQAKEKVIPSSSTSVREVSVLEKLILKNGPRSPIPFVTAMDMVGAGIDTTANTGAFLLYNLANNQEKQEMLRQEVKKAFRGSQDGYLDEGQVKKMRYFKACVRESMRVIPTIQVGLNIK